MFEYYDIACNKQSVPPSGDGQVVNERPREIDQEFEEEEEEPETANDGLDDDEQPAEPHIFVTATPEHRGWEVRTTTTTE